MKKTIFVLGVVIVAMAFAACGKKSTNVAPTTDSTSVVTDSVQIDSSLVAIPVK